MRQLSARHGVPQRTRHHLLADDLRQFARDNMAHFNAPRDFHFVEELPKTATGKIQKYVLRGGRSSISKQ